jgi:SPP1 family predicted phage head-tail adaptor
MKAGQLRHYVIVQSPTSSKNSFGERTLAWTSNIGTWASIEPLRGREYFAGQQVQSAVTHKITTRHRTLAATTAITPHNARIRFESRTFNIHAVVNAYERDIGLTLMCSEEM